MLDVDPFSIHDFLNHIGSHLLLVLGAVCVPRFLILLVGYTLHTLCARVLLIHSHLKHIHHKRWHIQIRSKFLFADNYFYIRVSQNISAQSFHFLACYTFLY